MNCYDEGPSLGKWCLFSGIFAGRIEESVDLREGFPVRV